jgi:hypothetical protein
LTFDDENKRNISLNFDKKNFKAIVIFKWLELTLTNPQDCEWCLSKVICNGEYLVSVVVWKENENVKTIYVYKLWKLWNFFLFGRFYEAQTLKKIFISTLFKNW